MNELNGDNLRSPAPGSHVEFIKLNSSNEESDWKIWTTELSLKTFELSGRGRWREDRIKGRFKRYESRILDKDKE